MKFVREMKMRLVVAGLLVFCCISGRAAITLDLDNATTYAKAGINATLDLNTSFIAGNSLIGIYGFAHSGTPTLLPNGPSGSLFWSVCLDPLGRVDWNAHTYERLTFADANMGQGLQYPNPPSVSPATANWAASGSHFWGVQNASYIWRENYSAVLSADALERRERGASLALAMYEALYDSTDYGTLGGSHFSITAGMTVDMLGYYTTYLNSLSGFNTGTDIYVGDILRGDPLVPGQNGQEFVLIGTPVPEVTTMFAGAFLLVPFAMSALRFVRKSRTE